MEITVMDAIREAANEYQLKPSDLVLCKRHDDYVEFQVISTPIPYSSKYESWDIVGTVSEFIFFDWLRIIEERRSE